MTAQPLFDGTFSLDAVSAAAHALVQQLHDEAMATIATLADTWDQPAPAAPVVEEEPVTYRDPATWSVDEDEDGYPAEDDEDDVRVLPLSALPPLLLPQPRAPRNVAARVEQRADADAVRTDEFAVPAPADRELVAS